VYNSIGSLESLEAWKFSKNKDFAIVVAVTKLPNFQALQASFFIH